MRNSRIEELARVLTGCSTAVQAGTCYDECDYGHQSATHWDMVKLLAGDGTIAPDGEPIQVDGRFVHPDLLELGPSLFPLCYVFSVHQTEGVCACY
jgi:hypothetical protein